jgi:hypothetical protein
VRLRPGEAGAVNEAFFPHSYSGGWSLAIDRSSFVGVDGDGDARNWTFAGQAVGGESLRSLRWQDGTRIQQPGH